MSTARHADGYVEATAGEALDAKVARLFATPPSTRDLNANYGFNCTMTAKPGMGEQLVDLLLTGLVDGNPVPPSGASSTW